MEVWKDIPEFEGLYQASNLGKIRSLYRGDYKELTPRKNRGGYYYVNLYKQKKRKTITVHKIIATTFIDNSENKIYIDHINTIRTDNRVENLRWCTHKENCNNELTIKNKSISQRGNKNHMYGKRLSEETKNKISLKLKAKFSGAGNPMYKKKHSKEAKQKIGEMHKKENLSIETLEKMSTSKKGEKNWMYGKRGVNNPNAKKVFCITTGELFSSIKEAGEKYDIDSTYIIKACKGIQKSGGKHPETGEKMMWEYHKK
ncbi:NUMOD4 motif [uncultured Clostridium sp.]|uniref:NUMOD3 domain-containing DNA-binding protein n=1 Tax=uncultured Clostridium sp. TaxID=59620 RepID=UPI000822E13E|nr:NUMOD4 domain-containing protein [uncultured Clostridium sp.]SCJ53067.1 NUMOD4 motif [uncultured Clostridium sp.]